MILVRARTASRSRLLRPFNGLSLCFQTSPDGSYKFPWRGNLRWGWRESLAPALDSPGTGSRGLREFLRGNVIHQYKTFFIVKLGPIYLIGEVGAFQKSVGLESVD